VNATRALLACDVLADEIAALSAGLDGLIRPVVWLEMGLHDHPDLLRTKIQETIAQIEQQPDVATILLAYGTCGLGLAGLRAGRCALVIPKAHDCVSILLGSVARHVAVLRESPDVYFYSPGWIRGRRVPGPDREAELRATYFARYPDDPEMVDEIMASDREMFARHGCAAYVDLTGDAAACDYCRRCAGSLGWRFTPLQGDPALLRALLTGPWDDPRFLIVPPGRTTTAMPDGTLGLLS